MATARGRSGTLHPVAMFKILILAAQNTVDARMNGTRRGLSLDTHLSHLTGRDRHGRPVLFHSEQSCYRVGARMLGAIACERKCDIMLIEYISQV